MKRYSLRKAALICAVLLLSLTAALLIARAKSPAERFLREWYGERLLVSGNEFYYVAGNYKNYSEVPASAIPLKNCFDIKTDAPVTLSVPGSPFREGVTEVTVVLYTEEERMRSGTDFFCEVEIDGSWYCLTPAAAGHLLPLEAGVAVEQTAGFKRGLPAGHYRIVAECSKAYVKGVHKIAAEFTVE